MVNVKFHIWENLLSIKHKFQESKDAAAKDDGSAVKAKVVSQSDKRLMELTESIQRAEQIEIFQGTALFVDKDSGEFIGPIAEGTMGIILYAGSAKKIKEDGLNSADAIRIPRLLQLDELLNFHIAEISYHEGIQAEKAADLSGLGGAKCMLRPGKPNYHATIPGGDRSPCYVGFYLSPNAKYSLALVSEKQAWPLEFANYLRQVGYEPKDLYAEINRFTTLDIQNRAVDRSDTLETLLYLPDLRKRKQKTRKAHEEAEINAQQSASKLRSLGRSIIEEAYTRKDIGGWWFNLPICLYSWMTSDMERLLTGLLDDDTSSTEAATENNGMSDARLLSSWRPITWLSLARTLTLGLSALHTKGLIHGDPRPANIMAKLSEEDVLLPDHFRWIDVGLGYGHVNTNSTEPDGRVTQTPPAPLGGGRVTPFYAPERVESVEFEDADMVRLSKRNDGYYKLEFLWKRRTYEEPVSLLLKDARGKPMRELGKLGKGDRIQLREFIFDVESVAADHVVVSRIYEVVLDRVLIEHKETENETSIISKLQNVAISRYRVFKQWSQATDVFGLGILVLYMFFIRGLYLRKQYLNKESPASNHSEFYLEKSSRERIFHELSTLIRSQIFLNGFIAAIKERGKYANKSQLWQKDVLMPLAHDYKREDFTAKTNPVHPERIQQIVDHILTMDANFTTVLMGANRNNGLFVLIIYFCMSCVWRRDEVSDLLASEFPFEPYCDSREIITDKENRSKPARRAREDLELLCELINAAQINEDMSSDELGNYSSEVILRSRNDQMQIALENAQKSKREVQDKEAKISTMERILSEFEESVRLKDMSIDEFRDQAEKLQQDQQKQKDRIREEEKKSRHLESENKRLQDMLTRSQEQLNRSIFRIFKSDSSASKKSEKVEK